MMDFLASMGGVLFSLVLMAQFVLYMFTFKMMENFLVTKLFKLSLSKDEIKALTGGPTDPRFMIANLQNSNDTKAKNREERSKVAKNIK